MATSSQTQAVDQEAPLIPIALDQGLDTTSPPLMARPGALVDCLNYEITGQTGYRRIDGYEMYDGWTNGGITDYYKLPITISGGASSAALVAGVAIHTPAGIVLGTILSYSAGTLLYAPANKDAPMIVSGTSFDVANGTHPTGYTATANAVSGLATDSPSTFLTTLRSCKTALRSAVTTYASPVAGMYFFRNNMIVALDCPVLTYTDSTTQAAVQEGMTISWNGLIFRVITRIQNGSSMTLHVEPLGTDINVYGTIRVIGNGNAVITNTASTATVINWTGGSTEAYLVSSATPETAASRGTTLLNRSTIIKFANGTAAAETVFLPKALVSIGTDAANRNVVYVKNVVLTSGTFAAGTAAGYAEVILPFTPILSAGTANTITTTTDVLDFGGTVKYADIIDVTLSKISGTLGLQANGTHYMWGTYNFYGQDEYTEAYGVTGASRGFWAQSYVSPLTKPVPLGFHSSDATTQYSWGNIVTDPSALSVTTLDQPKYLANHCGMLAYGFIGGSVELSVVGEPRNFNGLDGGQEIATGDQLTGLLEGAGDTLFVFGRRSIHRIQGTDPDTLSVTTISANAGAFDYTAVLVGSTPVFTGPAGISSLDQTASYGDFQGVRLSQNVVNDLVPQLTADWATTSLGGAVMAMPARAKNQYRLWLATGEVYTVTLSDTDQGPKIMKSNYGLNDSIRVPRAWSSSLSDTGKEVILVAWDVNLATYGLTVNGVGSGTIPSYRQIFQLDSGWGFNGVTFKHYFDTGHIFSPSFGQSTGINKIRLHGRSYGLATLDIKSAGIENDYDQVFHTAVQDISLPQTFTTFYRKPSPVMAIVDQANWGLGIKLRIQGSLQENLTTTEPPHVCQVLLIQLRTQGAPDA